MFPALQESDHDGESGEGELAAHVAKDVRGGVPEVLPAIFSADIPKCVFRIDFGNLLLSKSSWDICFEGADVSFSLQPASEPSFCPPHQVSPVRRPVARALCFDDLSEPVSESFEFSAIPEVTTKRGRKPRSAKILVDTEVRRSARLSALRDGYHRSPSRVSQQAKTQSSFKRRRTRSSQPEENQSVPLPTPVSNLQHIGARLRIAPELISKEKLEADPSTSTSSKGSDD